jgi:CHAT domain-containing protein
MTMRGCRFLRRWLVAFAIASSLIATAPPQAEAQQGNIADLIFAGRNVDAIELAKRTFEAAPAGERQSAFQLAARVCVILLDLDCARDVSALADNFLSAVPPADLEPATAAHGLLLLSFIEISTGHYQSVAAVLDEEFPIKLVNAVNNPSLFAELQLLAARRSRLVLDFEASRDHLDKALASVLSMTYERFDAARLLVRIAGQLLENYDAERALRLVAAAEPFLLAIPPNSFLAYELLQLRATLVGYRKDLGQVSKDLRQALATLEQLQLASPRKSFLKSMVYNELLGAEVLRGDRDAARNLLQSHPLQASRDAILKRGYFADASEFNFAVADEFVRLVLADPSDKGWADLMKLPPRWTADPERLQDVQAFGQAAVGLKLLRTGKVDEGRQELIAAGRKRLGTLQQRYRRSVYASPLPYWADQPLFEFAIAATLSSGGTPDYDLLLGAHVVLSRSVETSADDALASQSIQASDEKRRIAQSVRTIEYQRLGWEKTELAALAGRLSSTDKRSRETIDQDRLRILRTANDFAVQQRRLHAALIDANTSGGVDAVTRLANLRPLLLDDEALVFYVPARGQLGKICVRADRALSATQQLDATTATTDARLVRAALTATHPASIEADSQFPAVEAVRLGKLLFGGLEECLRSSRRIYHVTGALAGQVPPAALLAEVPPVRGPGYDLRGAHWLIRDHSFVRTSSIDAFVATKRLSRTRRAPLDYLGVGDPVLSSPPAALPPGALVANRDGLNALPQLPETSEEVERVANLFAKAKVRLLRRAAATEEAFRLEPLSEFDVVHFATHGLVRQELPGLREPSLVFTPDPRGDAFNDGLLTASQIAALPLRARLVILSACNSARYEPSIIDSGIQGLATSFAIAGVPSMIASLWPIESALTRDLIVDVFRTARGSGGVALADALALAIRRHLDGPAPRPLLHPRFWAALVVLGDGSITLDAEAKAGPRDLGPFAAINPSQDEEVLSAVPLADDFATSTIGAWNGKRSPSLIRRQAIDGTKKWEVADPEIGAGLVAASTQAIYAGGYLSFSKDASIVSAPILRALRPDGTVSWSHRLPSGPKTTMIMGLAVAPDQSGLALVGPTFGEQSGTDFSLMRVDTAGTEVGRLDISMQGNGQSRHSGYLGVGGTSGLAVINRDSRPKSGIDRFILNGLGLFELCWEGDAAEVVLLDIPGLKERTRVRIDRFRANSALAAKDGWIVVGDTRDVCRLDRHAAAYAVGNDGSVGLLWRDASPFDTFGRGIRKSDGAIEIVGYAQRSIAVQEEAPVVTVPDFSKKRVGNEAYVSGEVFSVRLSEQGVEERRDFAGAGFPIMAMGMASAGERSAIFGTVGSRPLWMKH